MKIDREEFLGMLNMVKSGLSTREFIEQSNCFVFSDGEVMTFNDEIACRIALAEGVDVTGAVQASSLLDILGKVPDVDLKVRENDDGELEFLGKMRNFAVLKQQDVILPIERVERPQEKDWRKIPAGLIAAISLVKHCVSSDESRFMLCCIHVHPEFVEACDNMQLMRCRIETGVKRPVLVRGSSLQELTSLGMTHMAQTDTWIHFRNSKGLVFSCRQYSEKYPELEEMIRFKGHTIELPKPVIDATDRAAVFATDRAGDPLVTVRLTDGRIRITGKGLTGWYKEEKKVTYAGPRLEFLIAPDLLQHICEKYATAQITDEKLKATGKDDSDRAWIYVTVLAPPDALDKPKAKAEEGEGEDEGDPANN